MKLLWKALSAKLIADTTLVALLGHTSSDIRIAYWEKEAPPAYPFLAFHDDVDSPWHENMTTIPQLTRVTFAAFAAVRVDCDNILTRLFDLLTQKTATEPNQYWDISNLEILNQWTHYRRRGPIEYDDKRQVFHGILLSEFRWLVR